MTRKTVFCFAALTGCTDTIPALEGTQSLEITLVAPANTGSPDSPLADTDRTIVLNVQAKDAQNQPDPSFDKDVQVYAQFLGTLTPNFGAMPLASFHVTAGQATNQTFDLPVAFGPTVIWIDDGEGDISPVKPADVNLDGAVNGDDVAFVVQAWGDCPKGGMCPADLNGDDQVNVDDLLAVIEAME